MEKKYTEPEIKVTECSNEEEVMTLSLFNLHDSTDYSAP